MYHAYSFPHSTNTAYCKFKCCTDLYFVFVFLYQCVLVHSFLFRMQSSQCLSWETWIWIWYSSDIPFKLELGQRARTWSRKTEYQNIFSAISSYNNETESWLIWGQGLAINTINNVCIMLISVHTYYPPILISTIILLYQDTILV